MKTIPEWLRWARELQAISQTGLHLHHRDPQRPADFD
jgi:hypothetical protein